jgi:hypothetical protein
MSLLEAITKKAQKHTEGLNRAVLASTYLIDLAKGAPGVEHPYKEAWHGAFRALAEKAGQKAVAPHAEVITMKLSDTALESNHSERQLAA